MEKEQEGFTKTDDKITVFILIVGFCIIAYAIGYSRGKSGK